MCGILGMIGTVPKEYWAEAYAIIQNIFILSKKRGTDASGFSAIHVGNKKLITDKRPIDSLKFVDRCAKFKALAKAMPNIIVAHTRFSTSGDPSRGRNNHPFNSNRYSIVHNGGITDWKNLVTKEDIPMRTETDSEILLHLLEREKYFHNGIQKTMDIVTDTSRVAIATLNYDKDPKLFLFRNTSNPIFVMLNPKYNAIFFASDKSFLEDALKSIYGPDFSNHIKQYDVDIELFPHWESVEFGLDSKGNPKITSKRIIIDSNKVPMGFSANSSNGSTDMIVLGSATETLPIPSSSNVLRPGMRDNPNTLEMLKQASPETKSAGLGLVKAMRDTSQILGSIREHPYMTTEEYDHFKKWMNGV